MHDSASEDDRFYTAILRCPRVLVMMIDFTQQAFHETFWSIDRMQQQTDDDVYLFPFLMHQLWRNDAGLLRRTHHYQWRTSYETFW